MMGRPHVFVIAGPNGAGKSTAAPALLRDLLGVAEYVNADLIAQGLSAFDTQSVAFQAGRVMLGRLHQLAARRRHFAFETTLATRGYLPWLRGLQADGYAFDLAFLWLPSADMAVARVAERVRLGGHDVPDGVVRRRYVRGLDNFFRLYRPQADRWWLIDNAAADDRQRLIATGERDVLDAVVRRDLWNRLLETHR
jgi:predicted ABC-type ATPase